MGGGGLTQAVMYGWSVRAIRGCHNIITVCTMCSKVTPLCSDLSIFQNMFQCFTPNPKLNPIPNTDLHFRTVPWNIFAVPQLNYNVRILSWQKPHIFFFFSSQLWRYFSLPVLCHHGNPSLSQVVRLVWYYCQTITLSTVYLMVALSLKFTGRQRHQWWKQQTTSSKISSRCKRKELWEP